MRTLIIPDVHEHCQTVRKLLAAYPDVDKRVFLGDWFDSFSTRYQPQFAAITARYIVELQQDPKNIFLLGNHDAHYRFPPQRFACSGFSGEKLQVINEILKEEYWDKFKLFYQADEWLLSHAGFHPYRLHSGVGPWMYDAAELAISWAKKGEMHPWLAAGPARGGDLFMKVGGCTWLDWNVEFVPVPHVNQIVGHTPIPMPEAKFGDDSSNYCLDTQDGGFAGILDENNELEIVRIEPQNN